ncbi:MAG: SDR family NAD(P)-dependent oxidoreductase [Planctomycetaceae bacterium]
MTMKPLDGQAALITGSSRGLGRVMAEELCRLGARVALHGTRPDSPRTFGEGDSMQQVADDVARSCDGETMAVWGDVTSESDVRRIVNEVRSRSKQIDILVCCAGGDIGSAGTSVGQGGRPENDDCLSITLDDLRSVMDRNLLGTILCCREIVPEMIERRSGRIITIGSIAGCSGRESGAIYSVAKAAVHEYTRCLAAQLRPFNIPVNCVAPGSTVTERFLRIHEIDHSRLTTEGTLERYGRPHEISALVGFLCTPGGDFISGQVLRVDGGSQLFPG